MKVLRACCGFTLAELLISLTLMGVILSFAVPSFDRLIQKTQINMAFSSLRTAAHTAKNEAIKRGTRVSLCPSTDGLSCSSSPARSLLIFEDRNRNGQPDHAKKIISRVSLNSASLTVDYNRSNLSFSSLGHASGTNGTFQLCHGQKSEIGRFLIVSVSGRTRAGKDYNGDGIEEKAPGHPVNCS